MSLFIPYKNGSYKGAGVWFDSKPAAGNFTSEFTVMDEGDTKAQITRRVFFKEDGSLLYEEHSTVRFTFTRFPFFEVTIAYEGKTTSGQGYLFNKVFHYQMDVSDDVSIENTYVFGEDRVELFGSSSNKGNPTVWHETLNFIMAE
ncbi:MAG: hypothetical protein AB1757_20035 [Acidobacteriota bacterium]